MMIVFVYALGDPFRSPDFPMSPDEEERFFEAQGDADNDLVSSDISSTVGEEIVVSWTLGLTPEDPQAQVDEISRLSGCPFIPPYVSWSSS